MEVALQQLEAQHTAPLMRVTASSPPEPPDYPNPERPPVPSSSIPVGTPSQQEYPQSPVPDAGGGWMDAWLDLPQLPEATPDDLWPGFSEILDFSDQAGVVQTDSANIHENEITDPTLIEALQSDNYIAFDMWLARSANRTSRAHHDG